MKKNCNGCGNLICAYCPTDPHCHSDGCEFECEPSQDCFEAEYGYTDYLDTLEK